MLPRSFVVGTHTSPNTNTNAQSVSHEFLLEGQTTDKGGNSSPQSSRTRARACHCSQEAGAASASASSTAASRCGSIPGIGMAPPRIRKRPSTSIQLANWDTQEKKKMCTIGWRETLRRERRNRLGLLFRSVCVCVCVPASFSWPVTLPLLSLSPCLSLVSV